MNFHAIRAIYMFEMARTGRTLLQSLATPSSRRRCTSSSSARRSASCECTDRWGFRYGAFIVPGLIMLSLLTESIFNASFGIFFSKFTGTIYEILCRPHLLHRDRARYVGAAATKSVCWICTILATTGPSSCRSHRAPSVADLFLVLTAVTFSLFGVLHGLWAKASSSSDSYRCSS